ncbi:hypothetical protein PUNSTDRAFT_146851 [Punctularia strigosozonata HHB-11173 SS5]|uniref:BTB domain-containing protein n=1 Tax=Punctularia strigosozonata (strain HHB-11173) TaxID=741275 RepID=R7S0G3_PUNST|nr:uncharacterized protein PUNSTDRAFT_146851 [Punctularia strigosozonata HHB-11173 SS5]EIN03885.1 hypothetical protein PUNSTDRAFT_146851 [Punctularia strigosozonata HHB-11173 SS5]
MTFIVDADYPFNKQSADIIFRTSDHVDFHVHKCILSEASPLFDTMFTLPQPGGQQVASSTLLRAAPSAVDCVQETKHGRPVIEVTETAAGFGLLLRLCYPYETPKTDDLDQATAALSAAVKYDMAGPTKLLAPRLREFAATCPLRVYAYAVRNEMEEEARFAASASLRLAIKDLELQQEQGEIEISATAYQTLIRYVLQCQTETAALATDFTWIPGLPGLPYEVYDPMTGDTRAEWHEDTDYEPPWFSCRTCPAHDEKVRVSSYEVPFTPRIWLISLLEKVQKRLSERPFGAVFLEWPFLDQAILGSDPTCRTCRDPRTSGVLRAFARHLAIEVDRKTAEIASSMTFC